MQTMLTNRPSFRHGRQRHEPDYTRRLGEQQQHFFFFFFFRGGNSRGSQGTSGAMIGGIVGGIAAALLLGGLIVWLFMRRRRSRPSPPSQDQQYDAVAQQPGQSLMPPAGPQMANAPGTAPAAYSSGDGCIPMSARTEGVSELSQTPVLTPAAAVSTYPVVNSLQKPISAPIAPVSPVSPHAQQYHEVAGHGMYGQGNGIAGQQQGEYVGHAVELENTVPGPREMDG